MRRLAAKAAARKQDSSWLGARSQRGSQSAVHVDHPVPPAAILLCLGEHLTGRLEEPWRPVTDRDDRGPHATAPELQRLRATMSTHMGYCDADRSKVTMDRDEVVHVLDHCNRCSRSAGRTGVVD